jgi:thiol-disulfide isomerase/thioredoxin
METKRVALSHPANRNQRQPEPWPEPWLLKVNHMEIYQKYLGPGINALLKSPAPIPPPQKLALKKLVLTALIICFALSLSAQKPRTKIQAGIPSPDFSLNVQLQGKGTPVKKTLADYKGRWLLLEFWTKTCATCIEGFPRLKAMADSLSSQMDFLLVGKNDKKYNEGIEAMYGRIAKEENLELSVAFDTLSFSSFGVWATPNAVVISPEGMIRSISNGTEVTLASLKKLINGEKADLVQLVDGKLVEKKIGRERKIIADTLGPTAHRSELTAWSFDGSSSGARNIRDNYRKGIFQSKISSLCELYMLATLGHAIWNARDSIYGKNWQKPLLELRDSTLFQSNFSRQQHLFAYRIEMINPSVAQKDLQQAMQGDLDNWFGFKARVQIRPMPTWKLVVLDAAKVRLLQSSTSVKQITGDHSGIVMKKARTTDIVKLIASYHQKQVIVDETDFPHDIDLALQVNLTNLEELAKALKEIGFGLVRSTKQMQVLVISDKNP